MEKKIELKVVNIANSQAQASAFALVLQEVDGERQLPIIIGSAEAQAIVLKVKDIRPPRPLTHDLFTSCLTSFNISLSEVLIYKAEDGIFYAYLYLRDKDSTIRIDARTSDAVALAVRFYCPIYIYESILEREQLTISTDEENEQQTVANEAEEEEILAANLKEKELSWLEKKLEEAIKKENYELASIIRDEISSRK